MEKVRDIANWFLSKESMTHKKVQKLCYYAQAWYCTMHDSSLLFEEKIEAWIHGPVIPALYLDLAVYRWDYIPKLEERTKDFSQEILDVLEMVFLTYGSFTGDELEILTRLEDPWKKARGNLKSWEVSHAIITCSSMKEFYKFLLKDFYIVLLEKEKDPSTYPK